MILAAAGTLAAPTAATARDRPVISLRRLGVRQVVLIPRRMQGRPFALSRSRRFAFALPAGTHEGGSSWYVIHLHFALELAVDSGSGLVDVSSSTDGRTSDSVQIQIRKVGHSTHLSWRKVGLIGGATTGAAVAHGLELHDENIMVFAGVRPGENYLQYEIETFGQVHVKRLVIYPDSGISESNHGPGTLNLHISPRTEELRVGQTLRVSMILTDPRARPVRQVIVGLTYDKQHFRLLNPPAQLRLPAVRRNQPYQHTFELRALAVGKPTISIGTQSVNANPEATITPTILAAGGRFRWSLWAPLAALALGVTLILAGRRIRLGAKQVKAP